MPQDSRTAAEHQLLLAGVMAEPPDGRFHCFVGCAGGGLILLADDLMSILVEANRNEFRMAQLACAGPFGKVDAHNYSRFDPNTISHFVGGEPLAPAAGVLFRKVRKWTAA